ncbi:MAG TPA: hypothetical protein VF576_06465 [Rubricoccaceae bacterium]|jgi:putative intracellular protease/amidase
MNELIDVVCALGLIVGLCGGPLLLIGAAIEAGERATARRRVKAPRRDLSARA